MAHHGYTVGYGFIDGTCYGSKEVHYGNAAAPNLIQGYVDQLESQLQGLPNLLEMEQATFRNLPKGERFNDKASTDRRRVGDRISQLESAIKELPVTIKFMKLRIKRWKISDVREVDVVKLKKEERAAKVQAADAKAQEKKAADDLKQQAKLKREAKQAENKKKYLVSIQEKNFHRVIYRTEVVVEWQASYSSERELIDALYEKKEKFYALIAEPKNPITWMGNSLYMDTRTKAEGKGRVIFSTFIKH
ncbi:MAG: hypothetical protein HAW67_03510 [Endozoicomonadaceae bacterium]|nr:hypothetical protein [Endozoicomonadaceae bacterium]